MWKNKRHFEKLKEEIYDYYLVCGLNLDIFLNMLIKNGIKIKNARKKGRKKLKIGVSRVHSQKFFAITSNLCYNVKKIGEGGRYFPLLLAKKNIGAILGAIIFTFFSVAFNGVLLSIDFEGSGKAYSQQVLSYIESCGVKKGAMFSQFDLDSLADNIVANNNNLSFASCEKVGNRLKVVLIKSQTEKLKDTFYELRAGDSGVVKELTVYRGTAVVNVGDFVSENDLLVGGYAVIKDKVVKINVIARVVLICEKEFRFFSELNNSESIAEMLAVEVVNGISEVVDIKTTKTKVKNGYEYLVKVYSQKVFSTQN